MSKGNLGRSDLIYPGEYSLSWKPMVGEVAGAGSSNLKCKHKEEKDLEVAQVSHLEASRDYFLQHSCTT